MIIEMSLANRDLCISQIETQIESKKKLLLEKQKILKKSIKQNDLLTHVKNDYIKYYQFIIQQKIQQMKAMEILNQYLHQLTVSGNLSSNNIKDAKREQQNIMNEIHSIQYSLDKLIKETSFNNLENK
jgi:hypothetical protein